MTEGYIGSHVRSFDAKRLVMGRGQFLDDLKLPGAVCAHFLRSPHAHAQIKGIDYSGALSAPGVLGVWTALEIGTKIKPIRSTVESESYQRCDYPVLAKDKVRFQGEPVAVLLAADRYQAEDAAEAILVDYVPLTPLSSVESSINGDGTQVHERSNGNVLFDYKLDIGAVDDVFRRADIRVARSFRHSRCTGLAMENRGVAAQFEPARKILTVWSSTQIPDLLRKMIAECLEFPAHKLRVVAPDVGGAFGVKMHVFPEELVVAFLARELRRPVKWTEDRRENLMASTHARDHLIHAEIAATKDGRIAGFRVRDLCNAGAYSVFPPTAALETLTCASVLPGPYKVANYSFHGQSIATDKCPAGAYRGVGFVLGTLVSESLMDLVARELRMDPAEVRLRNFIEPADFPYQTSGGVVYDSGDYHQALRRALDRIGYHEWRAKQSSLRGDGRYIGIGISSFVEPTGMGRLVFRRRGMADVPAFDSATVKIDPSGTVRGYLSTPSQGQGQTTTFAQLLADELGAQLEDIAIYLGDTELCPAGNGTFASRAIVSAGSALALAAREMRQRLLCAASQLLQVPAADLDLRKSSIRGKDGANLLSLADLARAIQSPMSELSGEINLDLQITRSFSAKGAAVSYGTHIAVVEVDTETGIVSLLRYVVVEDCGKAINPGVIDGQIRGGLVQGIGSALFEDLQYDAQGQLLTGSLMDYLIPGAMEAPVVEIEHTETPSPLTPTGCKGVGESGTIAAPAAIGNAISDALSPFGISFTEFPVTPRAIVEAVQQAVGAKKGSAGSEGVNAVGME